MRPAGREPKGGWIKSPILTSQLELALPVTPPEQFSGSVGCRMACAPTPHPRSHCWSCSGALTSRSKPFSRKMDPKE